MKIKNTNKLIIISFVNLNLLICGCDKNSAEKENKNYLIHSDTIILPENSNIKSRIKSITIQDEEFRAELVTTGIVRSIPNRYAEIAPPFAGRVLKSYIKLGQKVTTGSPIFEISSPDYFSAQKEYFDAKSEFKLAEQNLKRQQDLLKNGVGVLRELEEAETEYETKKSALENATAALKIFNIDPSKVVLGQPLVVTSPIEGEIVNNKIVIGQYLKEDAPPVAIVAELSTVWVAGQIKEKDIPFIQQLDKVEVKVDAYPDKILTGSIYHVKEIVDEETRSVEVLIECNNNERILRPGMFVTVKLIGKPKTSVLIPAKAILQFNDNQFVFVNVGVNKYQIRKIETDGTYNDKVIVKSGLKKGESIISEGGIYLLDAK